MGKCNERKVRGMSLIDIRELTKTYRTGDVEVAALCDVTARIDEAAFVSVGGSVKCMRVRVGS